MPRPKNSIAALSLIFAFSGWLAAQTPALSPRDLDIRLDNQLYESLKLGTTLYNQGDHEACFRIYQGSLITALGFLDHRPEQQAMIQKHLKSLESSTSVSQRANALRQAIDELRTSFKPNAVLWDRLGGESSVTALVEDFVTRVVTNPKVNFSRRGSGRLWDANPDNLVRLKKLLVQMIASTTGGPLKYEGRDMKTVHRDMKITEAEFAALAADLKASLDKFKVAAKDQEELLKIIAGTKGDIVEPVMPALPALRKPLWDRVGGEAVLAPILDEFMRRALDNPAVNFTRKGLGKAWDPNPTNLTLLKQRLLQFISSITGGPLKYEGRDLKTAHQEMKISTDQFDALTVDFKAALNQSTIAFFEKEELLSALADTKSAIVDPKTVEQSLWLRLGGDNAVTLMVDDFVERTGNNPKVNFARKGTGKEWNATPENVLLLKKRLIQFLSSISGGPHKYEGKDMKSAHQSMQITEAEFNALVEDLKATLQKFKIAAREQNEVFKAVSALKPQIVDKK